MLPVVAFTLGFSPDVPDATRVPDVTTIGQGNPDQTVTHASSRLKPARADRRRIGCLLRREIIAPAPVDRVEGCRNRLALHDMSKPDNRHKINPPG